MSGRPRRVAVSIAAVVALALLAVLLVEARLATNREYLAGPGGMVQATVSPSGGPPRGEAVRIVMLGDSTVAGVGSPSVEQSLPVLVAERVAEELGRRVEVTGLGVSGARTVDVRDRQVPRLVDARADVVVIVIGSNDVTHVTPPWLFDDQTATMLRAARRRSDAAVVLGGIPLFGSAAALAEPLRTLVGVYARPLRRIQRRVAARQQVAFVDIAADASPRFAGVPEAMSSDGFHPSPVGYGFWADAIAPAVTRSLSQKSAQRGKR